MPLWYQKGKYMENLCVKQTCITLPQSTKHRESVQLRTKF